VNLWSKRYSTLYKSQCPPFTQEHTGPTLIGQLGVTHFRRRGQNYPTYEGCCSTVAPAAPASVTFEQLLNHFLEVTSTETERPKTFANPQQPSEKETTALAPSQSAPAPKPAHATATLEPLRPRAHFRRCRRAPVGSKRSGHPTILEHPFWRCCFRYICSIIFGESRLILGSVTARPIRPHLLHVFLHALLRRPRRVHHRRLSSRSARSSEADSAVGSEGVQR
jgi:hypothetical protein